MRQASRRSWRIGQTRPVKVVFMSYRNTLQADALKLVAKKLQSSLAVEGELPEDSLVAYGDDGDDLMMAIARKIVRGDEDEAETVEDVFAQARDAEATAEELLVDEGWKTFGVALEVFGANRNGANEIEPRIEVLVGGNGHHAGEPDEGQRSLFSWTGFMAEEPAKTSRGRKPKHASASLFEWAFSLEREREAEPVSMSALIPAGAGHSPARRGGHRNVCDGFLLPVHMCGSLLLPGVISRHTPSAVPVRRWPWSNAGPCCS